jgi:hypothetical protein
VAVGGQLAVEEEARRLHDRLHRQHGARVERDGPDALVEGQAAAEPLVRAEAVQPSVRGPRTGFGVNAQDGSRISRDAVYKTLGAHHSPSPFVLAHQNSVTHCEAHFFEGVDDQNLCRVKRHAVNSTIGCLDGTEPSIIDIANYRVVRWEVTKGYCGVLRGIDLKDTPCICWDSVQFIIGTSASTLPFEFPHKSS